MADVPAVAPTLVPEKPANAPTTASAKNKPSSSPMPILEKPVDAPATTLANKKPPSSSNSKKRKGKGPPDPVPTTEALVAKRKGKGPPNLAPAAEVPVAKKTKTGDARTSTAEPPRSRVAVAAVQTLPSASSAAFATLRYGLPVPRSTLPLLQDADTDGQMPQQDPNDKKIIICDDKLKKIFGGRDRVGFLEISRLLNPPLSEMIGFL